MTARDVLARIAFHAGRSVNAPDDYKIADAILASPDLVVATEEELAGVLWDTTEYGAESPWIDLPTDDILHRETLHWAAAIARALRKPSGGAE
jgi:hypothetical protein